VQDLHGNAPLNMFEHFHAENRIERFVGEGELLKMALDIGPLASLGAEYETVKLNVAANGRPAAGGQLTDQIPCSTSGIEESVVRGDLCEVEEPKLIEMPSPANGISCSEGVVLAGSL